MKKNVYAYCLLTLAIGYALGAFLGLPCADSEKLSGDVNALPAYSANREIITSPDYMCFQKKYARDKEAQARTVASLRVMYSRIAEFSSLYRMACMSTVDNDKLQNGLASLTDVVLHNSESFDAAAYALKAAQEMQEGKKVDMKKALRNAKVAYAAIESQIAAGKAFVASVDSFITPQNLQDNNMAATARDMVASHCSVNASLAQNDDEIDYWSNMSILAPEVNMASK